MFSDINSASVFVSRRRVSSAACARSVLRIDTAPQRNEAICASFRAHAHRQSSRPSRVLARRRFARLVVSRPFVNLARSRARVPPSASALARARRRARLATLEDDARGRDARLDAISARSRLRVARDSLAARTRHNKNTVGPYPHLLSPGGGSTAYTTPSITNMTSAHDVMNHTFPLRPTSVLFSSSSFVPMVGVVDSRARRRRSTFRRGARAGGRPIDRSRARRSRARRSRDRDRSISIDLSRSIAIDRSIAVAVGRGRDRGRSVRDRT